MVAQGNCSVFESSVHLFETLACVISVTRPSELDALAYGHLYSLITTALPATAIADTVKSFENLAQFCRRVDRVYFQETEIRRDFQEDASL